MRDVRTRNVILTSISPLEERGKKKMTTKKKSGAPDPKLFESTDTISKFDPVRQWLIKNFKKVCKKSAM